MTPVRIYSGGTLILQTGTAAWPMSPQETAQTVRTQHKRGLAFHYNADKNWAFGYFQAQKNIPQQYYGEVLTPSIEETEILTYFHNTITNTIRKEDWKLQPVASNKQKIFNALSSGQRLAEVGEKIENLSFDEDPVVFKTADVDAAIGVANTLLSSDRDIRFSICTRGSFDDLLSTDAVIHPNSTSDSTEIITSTYDFKSNSNSNDNNSKSTLINKVIDFFNP